VPAASSVFLWLQKHKDFSDQYARATAARADQFAEEIIEIADEGSNDTYEDDEGREYVNQDVIQRSRLRVDTRKWLMARMAPKKYGDKVEQILSGGDKPVAVTRVEMVPVAPRPIDS
jgi:terminase small subunit-like protein